MKTSAGKGMRTLWKRFCEDERASVNGPWVILVILLWIAAQSLAGLP